MMLQQIKHLNLFMKLMTRCIDSLYRAQRLYQKLINKQGKDFRVEETTTTIIEKKVYPHPKR